MTHPVEKNLGLSTYPESGGIIQKYRNDPHIETQRSSQAIRAERRGAPRRRMLKQAEIEIGGNFGKIPCIVRNISDSGALVELDGQFVVPHHFNLIVTRDGTRVACKMARQDHLKLGINFTGETENFRSPEKQFIQASSDDNFKNMNLADLHHADQPTETEQTIRRKGHDLRAKKPVFGNR